MKIYWTTNSIPELQGLPKTEQRRLWRAGQRAARCARVWAGYTIMLIGFLIGGLVPALIDTFPRGMLPAVVWGVFWGGSGAVIFQQVLIATVRPLLAAYRSQQEGERAAKSRADDGSYYVPPAF